MRYSQRGKLTYSELKEEQKIKSVTEFKPLLKNSKRGSITVPSGGNVIQAQLVNNLAATINPCARCGNKANSGNASKERQASVDKLHFLNLDLNPVLGSQIPKEGR